MTSISRGVWYLVVQGYDATAPTHEDSLRRGLIKIELEAADEAHAALEARVRYSSLTARVGNITGGDGERYPRHPRIVYARDLPESGHLASVTGRTITDFAAEAASLGLMLSDNFRLNIERLEPESACEDPDALELISSNAPLYDTEIEQFLAAKQLLPAGLADLISYNRLHQGDIPAGSICASRKYTDGAQRRYYFVTVGHFLQTVSCSSSSPWSPGWHFLGKRQ